MIVKDLLWKERHVKNITAPSTVVSLSGQASENALFHAEVELLQENVNVQTPSHNTEENIAADQ